MTREARTPGEEFRIAVAGPIGTLIVLLILYVGTQAVSTLIMSGPTMDKTQRQMMMLLPLFMVLWLLIVGFLAIGLGQVALGRRHVFGAIGDGLAVHQPPAGARFGRAR